MNGLLAQYLGCELHVILDNLNTRKPSSVTGWRGTKTSAFTSPTMADGSNQVEVWFSILVCRALAGASFASPHQVRERIDTFIAAYNPEAHPFEWTKEVVFSKHPRCDIR